MRTYSCSGPPVAVQPIVVSTQSRYSFTRPVFAPANTQLSLLCKPHVLCPRALPSTRSDHDCNGPTYTLSQSTPTDERHTKVGPLGLLCSVKQQQGIFITTGLRQRRRRL